MQFKTWLETFQPALPLFQQEDPSPKIGRYKSKDNYVRAMSRGGRDTENAAKSIVSAPPGTFMAPEGEEIVNIIPNAAPIKTAPDRNVALVFLQMKEPFNTSHPDFQKRRYRLLAYWQRGSEFDKSVVFDGMTKPIGGILGMGGYVTHAWVDPEFRGKQENVPNVYQLIMTYARKMGIHGLLPEKKECEKCGSMVQVNSIPEKCPKCGTIAQPLTSKSFRAAQAKHDWDRSKNESMSREGRDEYVARYSVSDKTFEIWLRITGPNKARITYLNSYGQGTGTFKDVLPEFMADLKKLNIVDVDWSSALDDKTQGKARDRLFNRYKSQGENDY